ncbi:MAG: hypothetical protein EOP82_05005 [Variovorax sp.]|nr:MAG: hypothetical protein EOP82_05005 [Variovorax sp.]
MADLLDPAPPSVMMVGRIDSDGDRFVREAVLPLTLECARFLPSHGLNWHRPYLRPFSWAFPGANALSFSMAFDRCRTRTRCAALLALLGAEQVDQRRRQQRSSGTKPKRARDSEAVDNHFHTLIQASGGRLHLRQRSKVCPCGSLLLND